jgi:hypothetical protein
MRQWKLVARLGQIGPENPAAYPKMLALLEKNSLNLIGSLAPSLAVG